MTNMENFQTRLALMEILEIAMKTDDTPTANHLRRAAERLASIAGLDGSEIETVERYAEFVHNAEVVYDEEA